MRSLPVLLFSIFVLKPLLYLGVVAAGALRWSSGKRFPWLRFVIATVARYALGWIVGAPAGLTLRGMLTRDQLTAFYVLFFALRFVLWVAVLRLAFRKAPLREILGLSAVGTVVNAGIDLTLGRPLDDMFVVSFC